MTRDLPGKIRSGMLISLPYAGKGSRKDREGFRSRSGAIRPIRKNKPGKLRGNGPFYPGDIPGEERDGYGVVKRRAGKGFAGYPGPDMDGSFEFGMEVQGNPDV